MVMYSRPHIVIPFNKGLPIRSVVQPLFLCDALETWPWQCFLPCMFCGDDRYPSGCGTLARVYLSSLVIDDVHCLNPGHIKGARFFGRAISEISGR